MRNEIFLATNAILNFAKYWELNFKDSSQSNSLSLRYGVECVTTLMGDEELSREEEKLYEYLFSLDYEKFAKTLEATGVIDIVIDRLEAS